MHRRLRDESGFGPIEPWISLAPLSVGMSAIVGALDARRPETHRVVVRGPSDSSTGLARDVSVFDRSLTP